MMGAPNEKKLQKSYFDVLGICCPAEVPLIEKILKPLDGVKDVSVIVPTKTVIVVHDSLVVSQLQIVKVLNQARLEANIRAHGDTKYRKKWPSPFAVASGLLLLLSFLKFFYKPFEWLAVGAVAAGIPPILLRALTAIRNITLDINILVLIAVAGSIALKDYWEAGTIVFLFTIAEWLESRASHKATAVMSTLVKVVPQRAVLAETGEEVNADEVKLNTILAVKAGEIIPIDGVVVQGNCEVDEKTLTGESFPVPKEKDSTVWAGTINLNGYISIKTTTMAEDCVVARMAKLVEESQNNKSRTQRYVDKCAKYYTPVVVAISASLAIVPAALRVHNQKDWFRLALVALVSACPCALVLSTPVAMFCALSKAAASGVLFKGAEYLETLASVKMMAFDKTGTITRGEFMVTDFRSFLDDVSLNTLLYWVANIESKSSHPMATALVEYARSNLLELNPDMVEQFQNFPGEGVYGKINGKEIYVGNRKISSRAGCAIVPSSEADAKEGNSIGYIFLGSSPAGIFSLSDVCRTGAKEAIKELKLMGIKTAMLTGDCYAAAKHARDQIGCLLDVVHAELLPQDKARIIKEFQKESPTAMIGDGLNDAPALAAADIGISMGISGSALATETGHVILMSNDIQRIPKAAHLARRVRRKVIENMVLSITTKSAILALAIAGHPLVWAAVLADVGTCLLVIFNSMLLLRGTTGCKKKCCKSSAASHIQKHSCATESHCQPSQNFQPCCSATELRKRCNAQTCSSKTHGQGCQASVSCSKPCGAGRHSESSMRLGCQVQSTFENIHIDHGGCKSVPRDMESRSLHATCPCHPKEETKCSAAIGGHDDCKAEDRIHARQHHSHGNQNLNTNEKSNCSLGLGQTTPSGDHCAVNCYVNHQEDNTSEELGNIIRECCKKKLPNQDFIHFGCKRSRTECSSPDDQTTKNLREERKAGCHDLKACPALEMRQVGGCCESFRKECCTSNMQLGATVGGSLSEIIIE